MQVYEPQNEEADVWVILVFIFPWDVPRPCSAKARACLRLPEHWESRGGRCSGCSKTSLDWTL